MRRGSHRGRRMPPEFPRKTHMRHMIDAHPSARAVQGLFALMLAFALALFTGVSGNAEEGTSVATVTKATLTSENGASTITDGNGFKLALDWKLASGHSTAKATLTVDMPQSPELAFSESSEHFDMVAKTQDGTTTIGTCTVSSGASKELVCTIDNGKYLSDYSGELTGQVVLSGTMSKGNDAPTGQTYTFGGQSTGPVTILPKGTDSSKAYGGQWAVKWGNLPADDSSGDTIEWFLNVPDENADGTPGGTKVTITDDVAAADSSLSYKSGSAYVRYAAVLSAKGELIDWKTASVAVTYDETTHTFTFTTPTDIANDFTVAEGQRLLQTSTGVAQAAYQLVYKTTVDKNVKYPSFGTTYYNSYSVAFENNAEPLTNDSSNGTYTVTASSAWGVGTKQGAFAVGKKVTGTAASSIPVSTEYTVKYEVIAPESHIRTGSFTVKASENGADTVKSPGFDDGDTVKITEVKPADTSAVTWKDPVLEVAGQEVTLPYIIVTFSSENGNLGTENIVQLLLTNTADQNPGSISWTKVDADGRAQVQSASSWTLTYPDGSTKTVVDNGDGSAEGTVADSDAEIGAFKVADLAWGTYSVAELTPPDGYQLDTTAHEATISATALHVLASDDGYSDGTIANSRIPADNTGDKHGLTQDDTGTTNTGPTSTGTTASENAGDEQSTSQTEAENGTEQSQDTTSDALSSDNANSSELAQTGAPLDQLIVAALLLAVGATGVVLSRRRSYQG